MSGTAAPPLPPPPPLTLPPPKRSLRTLNPVPAIIVVSLAAAGIAGVLYTIGSGGGLLQSKLKQQADVSATQGANAGDVLAHTPPGTEIVAFRAPLASKPVVKPKLAEQTAPAAAPPAPPVPDDMTDEAIAARKAAWAAYYQGLAQLQRDRLEAVHKGMAADFVVADNADSGKTSKQTAAAGAPLNSDSQAKGPADFMASVASNPATDYLPFTETDPISPLELKAGDVITGKQLSGLNSDTPGLVKALVARNVLDHATGMHILIPQGSTLVGVYDTSIHYGQERVPVAWQRILYPSPCDQSLDLGAMPGADQTGQAGFHDLTDNHLGKVFTSAILVSVFGAAAQLSQPAQSSFSAYSPTQTATGAVGQQMAQLGQEFARKGLEIPPTERIRQGYEFSILLTKDIAFDHDWQPGVCRQTEVQVAQR